MPKKRPYGVGSIYQEASGRWVGAIVVDSATRRRKKVTGWSRREVADKLEALKQQHRDGLPIPDGRRTVTTLLEAWLEHVRAQGGSPRTYKAYLDRAELHLAPTLGHIRLIRLQVKDVDDLLAAKRAEGLSDRTVYELRGTLRTALNRAMRWGWVARNVAALAEAPRGEPYRGTALTLEQALALLAHLEDTAARHESIYVVVLLTALRLSEVLGLRWQDVDLEQGRLSVRGQLERDAAGVLRHVGRAKTSGSAATLPLPGLAVDALRRRRAAQLEDRLAAGRRWVEQGLIWTTHQGKPLIPRNVERDFALQLERAELPHVRFHDLRHTTGSLLKALGVDLKVIQGILRHATLSMTADTYTHTYRDDLDAAAALLDRALRRAER